MKMPEQIGPILFAPCGMNCLVCYKYCCSNRPCAGCLGGERGKPAHCRTCAIKDCAAARGLSHCHGCDEFPCKAIKRLDKNYRTRYGMSLLQNSLFAKEHGTAALLERHKREFACPVCNGVISLHDARCSQCQKAISK